MNNGESGYGRIEEQSSTQQLRARREPVCEGTSARGDSSWSRDSSWTRSRESNESGELDRMKGSRSSPPSANHAGRGSVHVLWVFSPIVDDAETSSRSSLQRRERFEGGSGKRRGRSESDSMYVSSFLRRGRRSENISECRGEEGHRFEPARQNERNQKPSWRGQSVLSRALPRGAFTTRNCIELQRSRFSVSWGTFVSV